MRYPFSSVDSIPNTDIQCHNLVPPPPSDPYTPNEAGPGTPNSTTTSISALSVVAIKDGAVGHTSGAGGHRQSNASASTLEAERADRISRLAGLERVATVRSASGHLVSAGSIGNTPGGHAGTQGGMGGMLKEISTVGSASATGSVGGKTTWAEQSEMDYDADKMSEDQDHDVGDGTSSIGGQSDEMDKASLVAFGEGAGSTISGPVNTANARLIAARSGAGQFQSQARSTSYLSSTGAVTGSGGSTPMSGVERPTSHSSTGPGGNFGGVGGERDPKMMDGVTFDQDIVDTTVATPPAVDSVRGAELAENVMRDRLHNEEMTGMNTPPENRSLGRFGFEKDQ